MAECKSMTTKIADNDEKIAALERVVSQEKADTGTVVQDLAVQLRYQRRIANVIRNGPPPPFQR